MLQSIKKCIFSDLALQDRFEIKSESVICLDVSYGTIDGYVCLFFGPTGDCPVVVAKSARTMEGKAVNEIEFDNLLKLEKIGINSVRRTTPEPLGLWHENGTLVTLQSALPGALMKNIPGKRLFSPENIQRSIAVVTAWRRNFQVFSGIKRTYLSDDVYASNVLAPVRLFLQRFRVDSREIRFLSHRYLQKNVLLGEVLPFMMQHGDFCTANILLQPEGIGVIDWEFPLKHQLPLFDLFFFFSSLRFPYRGYRGESNHFKSFTEVFWGGSYINGAMRRCIRETCAAFQIPERVVPDLFLLSLIQIANMKYDASLKSLGIHENHHTDGFSPGENNALDWESLEGFKVDVPFSCIRKNICETVRFAIRNGLPALT